SLRLSFETRDTKVPQMYILAEPYEESEIDAIQTGEYIKALRLAEERARAKKSEDKEKVVETSEGSQDQQVIDETSATNGTDNSESETQSTTSEETQSTTSQEDEDLDGNSVPDSLLNTSDRELLGMVLKTQSYINGTPITGPPTPTAQDRWEMTFTY